MNKIKQSYYYFFYVLYRSRQNSENNILPRDFIASLYIIILEIFLFMSFVNYYNLIFYEDANILRNDILIATVALLTLLDYIIIHNKDQWKYLIKEFDKLSIKKYRKTKNIVYSIIIFIISNFIFSFYLLFAQAKKNQTGPYAPEFVSKERRQDSLQKAQQIEKLKKIYGEDKK